MEIRFNFPVDHSCSMAVVLCYAHFDNPVLIFLFWNYDRGVYNLRDDVYDQTNKGSIMAHYEVEYSKKENGWIPKKRGSDYKYRRVTKSPSFSTIEETEKWIRETDSDRPWIDHVIGISTGHLMLIEDWKEDCDQGAFIDYDGYGELISESYEFVENGFVRPSTRNEKHYPPEAKYILWYNR